MQLLIFSQIYRNLSRTTLALNGALVVKEFKNVTLSGNIILAVLLKNILRQNMEKRQLNYNNYNTS